MILGLELTTAIFTQEREGNFERLWKARNNGAIQAGGYRRCRAVMDGDSSFVNLRTLRGQERFVTTKDAKSAKEYPFVRVLEFSAPL